MIADVGRESSLYTQQVASEPAKTGAPGSKGRSIVWRDDDDDDDDEEEEEEEEKEDHGDQDDQDDDEKAKEDEDLRSQRGDIPARSINA